MNAKYYNNVRGYDLPERELEPKNCYEEEQPVCQCSECGQDIWPGQHTFEDGFAMKMCKSCFEELLKEEYDTEQIAKALGFDVMLQG